MFGIGSRAVLFARLTQDVEPKGLAHRLHAVLTLPLPEYVEVRWIDLQQTRNGYV